LDSSATPFDYSEMLFGARIEQELPATWVLRFDFDLGVPSAVQNPDFGTRLTETDRTQDAIHLAHAALSRSFASLEGAFVSSHWRAGVGFAPAKDIRVILDGGQFLSALAPTTAGAWWLISPKVEAEISSHAHLLLEGLFAPSMAPITDTSEKPTHLILGRVGLRLQWW
jgi:hypothetical protein